MFGDDDKRGQLALLDAMVFFAIALLVSGMLAVQARQAVGTESKRPEEVVADSALQAFLGASVGSAILLELEGPVEIMPHEKVADCLLAELHSVRDGHPAGDFEPLNSVLRDILEKVVQRPFHFVLSAYGLRDSGPQLLLELSNQEGPAPDNIYSSSTSIADEGETLMIVLQLCPSALPEIDSVGAGDLDLRLRVLLASHDVRV